MLLCKWDMWTRKVIDRIEWPKNHRKFVSFSVKFTFHPNIFLEGSQTFNFSQRHRDTQINNIMSYGYGCLNQIYCYIQNILRGGWTGQQDIIFYFLLSLFIDALQHPLVPNTKLFKLVFFMLLLRWWGRSSWWYLIK